MNGTKTFDGYVIAILHILSGLYNFRYVSKVTTQQNYMTKRDLVFFYKLILFQHSRYSMETEKFYGSQHENGSWYGMVGLVNQQVC